ncbi:MAG: hypothetical protein MOP51_1400, partial [Citricoccus sp.]|nr:hypothetical protein [Citricoccus sp. WCRC_4]
HVRDVQGLSEVTLPLDLALYQVIGPDAIGRLLYALQPFGVDYYAFCCRWHQTHLMWFREQTRHGPVVEIPRAPRDVAPPEEWIHC